MLRRLKLRGATGLAQVGAIKTGAGACDLLARPKAAPPKASVSVNLKEVAALLG